MNKREDEREKADIAHEPHSPERDSVDQEPGESQKRNQGDQKHDPLAA